MSLGSALLKRAYIAKCTSLPFSSIKFSRKLHPKLGKPCWEPPSQESHPRTANNPWPSIDFNISHQKGLVVFVGVCSFADSHDFQASIDIVSPNERNDLSTIASSGLASFVSTFESVFSESEVFSLSYSLPHGSSIQLFSGTSIPVSQLGRLDRTTSCGQTLSVKLEDDKIETFSSDLIIEEKLRTFYAAFSLKEAFVKLGGEGLAADWIQDCEFEGVRAPSKGGVPRCNLDGVWGGTLYGGGDLYETNEEQLQVSLKGKTVRDVRMEIQAYEEDYLISTMIRPASMLGTKGTFPDWHRISLERDIWDVATAPEK
jgi:4'-phosphopantetheinyl transferase